MAHSPGPQPRPGDEALPEIAPSGRPHQAQEAWEVSLLDPSALIAAAEMFDRLAAGDFYITEAEARLALADPR